MRNNKLRTIALIIGFLAVFYTFCILLSANTTHADTDKFRDLLVRAQSRGDWVGVAFIAVDKDVTGGKISQVGDDYFCLFDEKGWWQFHCVPLNQIRMISLIMATPGPTPVPTEDKR